MKLINALILMFVYLFKLKPHNCPYNEDMAVKTAMAIAQSTQSLWEAETLARIARWESGLRPAVADCTILGSQGERGIFQVKPRNHSESVDLCSPDLEKQARIALARLRESKRACERQGFRGPDVLGIYTHGACVRGNRFAVLRYGDGSKLRSFLESE